jgi:hypothetical protein
MIISIDSEKAFGKIQTFHDKTSEETINRRNIPSQVLYHLHHTSSP